MAIVRMKRLRVIALARQRDQILARLHHAGCVELSEPEVELSDPQWTALLARSESNLSQVRTQLGQVKSALQTLQKYVPAKKGLFPGRTPIKEEDFFRSGAMDPALKTAGEINDREREILSLQAQEVRLAAKRTALMPWATLDVDLGTGATKNVNIAFLVCPAGVDMQALMAAVTQAAPSAQVVEASTDKEQHYFLYLCHKSQEQAGAEAMKPFGVAQAGLKDFTGTASQNLATLTRESQELAARQTALVEEIKALASGRHDLNIAVDRLRQEETKQAAAQRGLTDETIVFFTGWVTEPEEQKAIHELEKFPCAWQTEVPKQEDYPKVPVKLKNNWLTRPLNMVTEMYSLPAYDGVDPNPLMAPFFILFYGIMMADMGYGLLMMLASVIVLKKGKPRGGMHNFFSLLGLCGISTFLMGALTGGFFGDFLTQVVLITTGKHFALPSLFTPLDDTLSILVGAMVLGFIQIVTGMAVSFVKKLKDGQVMDAIWEEVTWWVVFLGAGLAIAGMTNLVLILGGVMILAGAAWGAKDKAGFGKVTGTLMGIFGSLYNHVTGYFGDILSYSRLMALMLAGSVIAQVFNTLGAIPGNLFIFFIISLAGNTLNFALNLLGCYVHDLRLQCLEYFGKFYKDGGKPFRPLEVDTQYVDVINN